MPSESLGCLTGNGGQITNDVLDLFLKFLTEERSPLAKAAAGSLAVAGNTARGFESLPSPPLSIGNAEVVYLRDGDLAK